MKSFNGWFSDFGMREKLLAIFILFITIPVVMIASLSYTTSSQIVEDQTNRYHYDILIQTAKTTEIMLEKIEDISFNILSSGEAQDLLYKARHGDLDAYESTLTTVAMETLLSSFALYHDEVKALYVVSLGGYVYSLDKTKQNYGLMENYLERIEAGKGSVVWIGGMENKDILAVTRVIYSTLTQQPIAYMIIYVQENYLYNLLKSTYAAPEDAVFMIDEQGTIVCSEDSALNGTLFPSDRNDYQQYTFYIQVIDDVECYVTISNPLENGWRIVTTVPICVYQGGIIRIRNATLLFPIALLVLCMIVAWRLAASISKPIRSLSHTMTRFGESDLSVRSDIRRKDETGLLAASFNSMAENINDLVNHVYHEQTLKREAQLKSLQMQINPHFLYNTLETINWMARTQGATDIGIMAKSLGDLMRFTIGEGDYLPLKDELDALNNYLEIQKFRYMDKLTVEMSIDEPTLCLTVPKLIIQPLVENAIYHGIEPSLNKGTIRITSETEDSDLLLYVQDDGVGMDEDLVKHIMSRESTHPDQSSIGIQNVIQRIQTIYGKEYGLQIASELGEGTTITIRIPKHMNKPKGGSPNEP